LLELYILTCKNTKIKKSDFIGIEAFLNYLNVNITCTYSQVYYLS